MTEAKKTEKKKTSPLVFVGIGCFVLIVLLSLGTFIAGKFIASKIAGQGKMTFTDEKSGTTVDVGSGKMPDNFPKDFPVYPGVKVVSSLSGGQQGEGNGFWLTLSTGDSLDKVTAFYKTALASSSWKVEANYTANGTSTQAVKKGDMAGSVSIMREDGADETQIVIVLGEESN